MEPFYLTQETDSSLRIFEILEKYTSSLRKILPTSRLSVAYSLMCGLWNVISCQIAAPIYIHATLHVNVARVNNLYYYISEYFQNQTFAPSRVITQDRADVRDASHILNAECELRSV